jgi:uncharacterized protein YjlB
MPIPIQKHYLQDDGKIPNNTLPMLVYPAAVDASGPDPAAAFEALFAKNQWTGGSWRNGIYPFPHYHSTAHEVLGIASGTAKVRLGGDSGVVLDVQAGDVVLLPAGVGHQKLGASADLLVVGAYPPGQDWDLCRDENNDRTQILKNIVTVHSFGVRRAAKRVALFPGNRHGRLAV